jgi:glycosyltransferase involved in cell wall biosynthesis
LFKVKILALMPDAYGGFGGIAQYNRDLLDVLSVSDRVDAIVSLTRHAPDPGYALPAKLCEFRLPGNPIRYVMAAARRAVRLRPDVIVCGHFNLLPVAVMLKRLTGCPVVLETYGIEAWQRESALRQWSICQVDLVITISRYTREQLMRWSGLKSHKIKVVPNAVHLRQYKQTEKPEYLVRRYGLEGKRVLLTIGRLPGSERYKGHRRIIKLLPKLAAQFPELIYLIVGDGNDRPNLEALAQATGNQDRVIFAGRISEDEKIDHYNLADAFAMPSLSEGFGFVFLEAAACGLPVLGGNRDGSRDALVDGQLGVLVDPEDTDELLEGLMRILGCEKRVLPGIEPFGFRRFQTQVEDLFASTAKVA